MRDWWMQITKINQKHTNISTELCGWSMFTLLSVFPHVEMTWLETETNKLNGPYQMTLY